MFCVLCWLVFWQVCTIGNCDLIGERAIHHAGLPDDRGAFRLRVTKQHRMLHLGEIAAVDVAGRKRIPPVLRKASAGRVQLLGVVMIIDVVGGQHRPDGPVQQLGVVHNRAIERCQAGAARACRDAKVFGQRRMRPDIGIVNHECCKEHRHSKCQAEALVDKRRLEVRVRELYA